jgi:hypothetical protein
VEYFSKIYDELERKYVRGGEKKLKADYVRFFFFRQLLFRERARYTIIGKL